MRVWRVWEAWERGGVFVVGNVVTGGCGGDVASILGVHLYVTDYCVKLNVCIA